MITSQIELRHLRYFVALAEQRHFTRAAESANISQPTLSQQIRQLETAFGSPLVDRIGKRVSLTAAGNALLPHARSVLRQIEEACTAVGEVRGLKSGQLNIGVVQTVNSTLLPTLLARFNGSYPGIAVSTRQVSGSELETGVLTGVFDLAIGFIPTTAHALVAEELYEEDLRVVAREDHPLAQQKHVRMRDLQNYSLVLLPRGYCTRELLQTAFSSIGAFPNVSLEINSIEGILATIEQTGAATVLPSFATPPASTSRLKYLRLTNPTPKRVVGVVWREGAFRKAAATAFADLAHETAHELFATSSTNERTR